jgi:hypothetical protein
MARFQTVIKHVRFVYSPYTAAEMQGFSQVLADSIRVRIQSGQNIYYQVAAPRKPGLSGRRGYLDYKAARGLQPIRDWTWSGHTLRCLKVARSLLFAAEAFGHTHLQFAKAGGPRLRPTEAVLLANETSTSMATTRFFHAVVCT